MKISSGKVVATSFPYPTVHRSIAGDVPISVGGFRLNARGGVKYSDF